MLYTGKGDDGTTSFFDSKERVSKDHPLTEALGTVDELNSLLGLLRATVAKKSEPVGAKTMDQVLEETQQSLFIVQAELAGAPKMISQYKVDKLSELVNEIESELPEIKSFFIPGATQVSALFDVARTVARRAERRVIALPEKQKPSQPTMGYLNRLSSLLYALARLVAHRAGAAESAPTYE